MFRKTVAVLLAVCLLGGLCACGNSVKTNKKIAIITAPKDEYPEDYLAARALAQKYPETVVLRECEDSRILQKDDPQIVTLAQELAADPDVGAIIFARAARFTSTALIRAKSLLTNKEEEEAWQRLFSLCPPSFWRMKPFPLFTAAWRY